MVRRFVFLALVALAAASVSCSQFEEACAPVLQSVSTLQGKLADAQRFRSELEASGVRDHLPPAQQAIYDKGLAAIDEGYRVAVQALALTRDVCSEPDVKGAIDIIVRGVELVMPLLALVGGEGTPDIVPPVVWVEARGQ